MSSETDFQRVLPAWFELASQTDVSLGLDPSEAFHRAEKLLNDLRSGHASTEGWVPEADRVEVLHALVALACRDDARDPKAALADIELVHGYISSLPWPATEFGGPSSLLSGCAVAGWRLAHRCAPWPATESWVRRISGSDDIRARAEHAMTIPLPERVGRAGELRLDDHELLLCVCEILRSCFETTPSSVRDDAEFFFRFLRDPKREIGLHDEREYFLGEFALIAGTASRVLFKIDDAKGWFQRAEAYFALVQNANAHWARIAYQRMALAAEERRFDEVLGVADLWANTFRRLDMPEDALKCRFLEGAVCWELGDTAKAISINQQICLEAERAGHTRLVAQAAGNLVLYYGSVGNTEEALRNAQRALPVLQRLGDRISTVKLKWSMAALMRKQGQMISALEALREAQADARELEMRGDLAAIHLVIADLLLEAGQEAQAEWEIRAALPIIDEEKMVPEGIAALSLLRESLRRRQIDKQALRELHGYFQDK